MATAPAMDPNLDSLAVSRPDGCPAWLQTSPEYAMKRFWPPAAAISGSLPGPSAAASGGACTTRSSPFWSGTAWAGTTTP